MRLRILFSPPVTFAYHYSDLGSILTKNMNNDYHIHNDLIYFGFLQTIAAPVPDVWRKANNFAQDLNRPFAADLAIMKDLAYTLKLVVPNVRELSRNIHTQKQRELFDSSFAELYNIFRSMTWFLHKNILSKISPYVLASQLPQVSESIRTPAATQHFEALKTYLILKLIGMPSSQAPNRFVPDQSVASEWCPAHESPFILNQLP